MPALSWVSEEGIIENEEKLHQNVKNICVKWLDTVADCLEVLAVRGKAVSLVLLLGRHVRIKVFCHYGLGVCAGALVDFCKEKMGKNDKLHKKGKSSVSSSWATRALSPTV